jgi:hypothetical protein
VSKYIGWEEVQRALKRSWRQTLSRKYWQRVWTRGRRRELKGDGRRKNQESFEREQVQCEMRFIRNAQQNASLGRAWLLPGGLQRARGPQDVAAALGRESCGNDAANGRDTSRRGSARARLKACI